MFRDNGDHGRDDELARPLPRPWFRAEAVIAQDPWIVELMGAAISGDWDVSAVPVFKGEVGLGIVASPAVCGRVCALGLAIDRESRAWASRFSGVFHWSYFTATALGHAFASPWSTVEQLRGITRMALWLFALDDIVEAAGSLDEAERIVQRCLEVVDGAPVAVEEPAMLALADVLCCLRGSRLWPALESLWREALRDFLEGMLREHRITSNAAAARPPSTLEEYLADTSSIGLKVVAVSYWISTGEEDLLARVALLLDALQDCLPAVRLMNDSSSFERERDSGDANVLMFGVSPAEVMALVAGHIDRASSTLRPLIADGVPAAVQLERLTSFAAGFYGLADYRAADGARS